MDKFKHLTCDFDSCEVIVQLQLASEHGPGEYNEMCMKKHHIGNLLEQLGEGDFIKVEVIA